MPMENIELSTKRKIDSQNSPLMRYFLGLNTGNKKIGSENYHIEITRQLTGKIKFLPFGGG